jgi:hypothetical protein
MLKTGESCPGKIRKENKWLAESGLWEKIICLIQAAIAGLLCGRTVAKKEVAFDSTESGSVTSPVHFI